MNISQHYALVDKDFQLELLFILNFAEFISHLALFAGLAKMILINIVIPSPTNASFSGLMSDSD